MAQQFVLQGKWPIPREVEYLFASPNGRAWFQRHFGVSLPTQVIRYEEEECSAFLDVKQRAAMLKMIRTRASLDGLKKLRGLFANAMEHHETVDDLERLSSFNNWAGELSNTFEQALLELLPATPEKHELFVESTRPEWENAFSLRRRQLSSPQADLFAQYLSFGAVIKGLSESVINTGAERLKVEIYKSIGELALANTWLSDDTGCRPYSGDIPIIEREGASRAKRTFSGLPASAGHARGKARVATSLEEARQIQPGEILVALTTDAHYEPFMAKATAFVTEIGGVTAHAAIIAREQKKPCIVSVAGATQHIHTGDELEVDAQRGSIQIVSNP